MHQKSERRRVLARRAIEAGQAQWSMMEALTYAERAGIVICAALFFLHEERDFWTFWGLLFVVGQVMFLSPALAILIYLTERTVTWARQKKKNKINEIDDIKRLYRWINIAWFPLLVGVNWVAFDLYDRMVPKMGPVDFWRWLFA